MDVGRRRKRPIPASASSPAPTGKALLCISGWAAQAPHPRVRILSRPYG